MGGGGGGGSWPEQRDCLPGAGKLSTCWKLRRGRSTEALGWGDLRVTRATKPSHGSNRPPRPHTSRLSGGVPASGPEDYLLCSLLLFKNQPAFNHKSGDAEQRKSHPMSKRGDAAANPECTLAETCVPPCHQGPERQSQGHAPRQSAGSHLHTQCHPLYLCLLKCFPCLPGTSCACCLVESSFQ